MTNGRRPVVMGIINVTPDSFSDGGRTFTVEAALRQAQQLVAEGADLLDIGGESSRPGATPVPLDEELARVVPVVLAIRAHLSVPVSVDTTKAEVAARSLEAGATIINDIRGLDDPELAALVAGTDAGVILMHMRGTPQTMQDDPRYEDVVGEVAADLARRVDRAEASGIPRHRIAIDPGIGFGKTIDHNLTLLRELEALRPIGCAVVIGTSRKGFLGQLTGRARQDRAVASAVSALAGAVAGPASCGSTMSVPPLMPSGSGKPSAGNRSSVIELGRLSVRSPGDIVGEGIDPFGRTITLENLPATGTDLAANCLSVATRAQAASRRLATIGGAAKDDWLRRSAQAIRRDISLILMANFEDIAAAPAFGLNAAAVDRLSLDAKRLEAVAASLEQVAALPDPVGEVIAASRRPNGLEVSQVRVPLGVIFMIYESRPNVTADAGAIAVKSGNAVILRGGKESFHSNRALFRVLAGELVPAGLPASSVQLVETTDRAAVGHLLALPDQIDLAIPRGGESLIRRVAAEARMPVLKHYQGNCHIYVDAAADLAMAVRIIVNAKTQRPGVCNAAETLLVHRDIAAEFLPLVSDALQAWEVELRGDTMSQSLVSSIRPARSEDWDTEYLDLILTIGVVDSIDAAISHIERHGSGHTDAIVTDSLTAALRFTQEVDSSAVVINASTRFNDGGQLGLGAEIGISTDKFHARGPCGLRELTSTKWIIRGNGQIRE